MLEIIQHNHWLDNATAGLTFCLRDALPILKQQVNAGVAQLWEIHTTKGKSWMVSRVEQINNTRELVICCYQGCDLETVTPIIYHCAAQQGIDSIRYHTHRKGLNRLVIDLGFTPYETVYRKTLKQPQPIQKAQGVS